jgi:activator of HSP90 ATPase
LIPEEKLQSKHTVTEKVNDAYVESQKVEEKVAVTTLKMETEFVGSVDQVYDCLTNPQKVNIWTRGSAKYSGNIGDEFAFFGGNITGKLLEAVPNEKVVYSWRSSQWPCGLYSKVIITLEESNDATWLKLEQNNVPRSQYDVVKSNWSNYYWNPIKQAFGLGSFV